MELTFYERLSENWSLIAVHGNSTAFVDDDFRRNPGLTLNASSSLDIVKLFPD